MTRAKKSDALGAQIKRTKVFPTVNLAKTDADLVGRVDNVLPPLEVTLPPDPEAFPPVSGGIVDHVRVLRLAYSQMIIEKLQAQQTAYTLSFDSQIRELTQRRTTTLMQLVQELNKTKEAYLAVQREIEEAHGIVLAEFTFNPDVGTLNRIVDPSKRQDGDLAEGQPAPPS